MQESFPIHTAVDTRHSVLVLRLPRILSSQNPVLCLPRRLDRVVVFGSWLFLSACQGLRRKSFMATCIAPPRVLPAGFTSQLRNAPRWLNQLRKGRHASLASAPHLTQSLTERWLAKEGARRPRGFVVLAKVVSDVAPVTALQEVDEGILFPQNKQT